MFNSLQCVLISLAEKSKGSKISWKWCLHPDLLLLANCFSSTPASLLFCPHARHSSSHRTFPHAVPAAWTAFAHCHSLSCSSLFQCQWGLLCPLSMQWQCPPLPIPLFSLAFITICHTSAFKIVVVYYKTHGAKDFVALFATIFLKVSKMSGM